MNKTVSIYYEHENNWSHGFLGTHTLPFGLSFNLEDKVN